MDEGRVNERFFQVLVVRWVLLAKRTSLHGKNDGPQPALRTGGSLQGEDLCKAAEALPLFRRIFRMPGNKIGAFKMSFNKRACEPAARLWPPLSGSQRPHHLAKGTPTMQQRTPPMGSATSRRQILVASAGFAAGIALPAKGGSTVNTSTQAKPSIVFCHGIWADGSCFNKVIPMLQKEGHEVIAAQYGLDTLAGDVATVKRTLGRVSSPAILVGHSYGGSVITAAGMDDRVAGLVYIAALAPDDDETSQSQQEKFPVSDVFKYVEVADGRVWMKPEGVAAFAGDLSEQEQRFVWATHFAPAADLFAQKLEGTAWKSKPNWYIVANQDRTVQPELQRFVAKRMNARVHAVDASHVAMLSHPKVVIDVIRTAAQAVAGKVGNR